MASRFDSSFLANVYLLIGLNHEKLSLLDSAIQVYAFACRRVPNDIQLHYLLAMAYQQQQQPEKAVPIFKNKLRLAPLHHESHLQLGLAYYEHDYKSPALLSLLSFLMLEPNSQRSSVVMEMVDDLFTSGVETDPKTGKISLMVNPHAKTDEGDFRVIDNSIAMHRIDLLTSGQKPDEMEIKLEQLNSFLLMAIQIFNQPDQAFFVQQQYLPFYVALYKNDLTKAFLYYTHQSVDTGQGNAWLRQHPAQVRRVEQLFVQTMKAAAEH